MLITVGGLSYIYIYIYIYIYSMYIDCFFIMYWWYIVIIILLYVFFYFSSTFMIVYLFSGNITRMYINEFSLPNIQLNVFGELIMQSNQFYAGIYGPLNFFTIARFFKVFFFSGKLIWCAFLTFFTVCEKH